MRRATLIALTCAFCISALHISLAQDVNEPISARKILVQIQPQYPALARVSHINGVVKLLAHVGRTGRVANGECPLDSH